MPSEIATSFLAVHSAGVGLSLPWPMLRSDLSSSGTSWTDLSGRRNLRPPDCSRRDSYRTLFEQYPHRREPAARISTPYGDVR